MLADILVALVLLQTPPAVTAHPEIFPADPTIMNRLKGSRWELLVWDHDSAWFLDPKRAVRVGKRTYRVWLRSDFKELQHEKGVAYDYNISRLDLRCETFEFRILDVLLYSTRADYALTYEWHARRPDLERWDQIVPEGSFEKVRDEVCGELSSRFEPRQK